jgi:hypothetical protein
VVPARDGENRTGKVPATAEFDARLVWTGTEDRGAELAIVTLELSDVIIVILVFPTGLRRQT